MKLPFCNMVHVRCYRETQILYDIAMFYSRFGGVVVGWLSLYGGSEAMDTQVNGGGRQLY
jgi:hypothetical protein